MCSASARPGMAGVGCIRTELEYVDDFDRGNTNQQIPSPGGSLSPLKLNQTSNRTRSALCPLILGEPLREKRGVNLNSTVSSSCPTLESQS